MMREKILETIGKHLSEIIEMELTDFLGRKPYECSRGRRNYLNGFYKRLQTAVYTQKDL